MIESQAACSHPHLLEVDGLHGYYRCSACGDFFNLIQTIRHTPRDLAAMAHWFTQALKDNQDAPGDGDSNGVPKHGE